MSKLKLIGYGHALLGEKVDNHAFSKMMDTSDEWIRQRTGIATRYISDQSAANLGTKALEKALEKANIDKETLDLIIVATYATEDMMPNTASVIKRNLGIQNNAPAFDINVACSGFVYALEIARTLLAEKADARIAVIGAERQSQYLNYEDRTTAILFGDGAGAMIFEGGSEANLSRAILGNVVDQNNALSLQMPLKNTPFSHYQSKSDGSMTMKGQEVFQFAVRTVKKAIHELLEATNTDISEIDYFILHQANWRIISAVARSLKIDESKFVCNVDEVANTSSASIPIAFSQLQDSKIEGEKSYLFVGFGAGLAYGATLLKY